MTELTIEQVRQLYNCSDGMAEVNLMEAASDIARLALTLHTQLQQERAGREKLETAARNLIKANWANYGKPENEFIAYQTSGTGRERIQTEWLALDAALTQADSGRD